MDNFIDPSTYKQFVILDGQRIEADIAYQQIYSLAKHSIIIIDDYISVKTLRHLKICNKDVEIVMFSDNVAKDKITNTDIDDFILDTGLSIELKPTHNKIHDRYIFIDYGHKNEIAYHSGASSKDMGNKISSIEKIEFPESYISLIFKKLI